MNNKETKPLSAAATADSENETEFSVNKWISIKLILHCKYPKGQSTEETNATENLLKKIQKIGQTCDSYKEHIHLDFYDPKQDQNPFEDFES